MKQFRHCYDFPSNIQPPPKKQRRVVIKKKLPVPIQPPSADLRFEANTSMSSVLLLPLEHDQSVSTPNEQKSTVGLHQTPDKRKTASPSTSLSPRKVLLRRKVKALKQKLKRRDCKLRSMKELISNLKNKFKAPDSLIEIVENNFTGLPFELLLSSLKNKGKK
ncbi:uncharacterized protein LOC124374456 [Homalodisca vitripennis]|uniref:uncharacterized protein LOC124374456 n=1 Tax=Homalodisca vitripennis TaxID=197043 RepID=UPI001EEBD897|nr:uncharacterized protein LOC124374456 [Homalodisca vitripennis]